MFGRSRQTGPLENNEEITRLSAKAAFNGIPLKQDGNSIVLGESSSTEIVYDTSYYEGAEDALAGWFDSSSRRRSTLFTQQSQKEESGPWWKFW